jgi:uncharacterized protein (TIGR02001 family)
MKALHKTAISAAAVALLSVAATPAAFAADAPAPEVSPITANVTVASSYIYRGLTQTNNKPAIQGGFDYAHDSGFYIGNWNSSISWISDGYSGKSPTVTAPIEMDFYAGYKKEFIGEGFASDVGVLQYYYSIAGMPVAAYTANQLKTTAAASRQLNSVSPNTTEVYAAQNFTFGPLSGFGKLSYSLTNIFGIDNSKGSLYPDITVNYDTGFNGITLNAHAGYQYVPNNITYGGYTYKFSYADWKLGLTKDFGGGLSGSIAYTGTDNKKVNGAYIYTTANGGNAGRATGLVSLTKTF